MIAFLRVFFYFLLSFFVVVGRGQHHRLNGSSVQHAYSFIVAIESYLFGLRARSIKRFVADGSCWINLRSILQSTLWLKVQSHWSCDESFIDKTLKSCSVLTLSLHASRDTLSLSCSFSDMEYSTSDDDLQGSDGGIKPYMYEPIVGDSGGGGPKEPDSLGEERLTNTNWY